MATMSQDVEQAKSIVRASDVRVEIIKELYSKNDLRPSEIYEKLEDRIDTSRVNFYQNLDKLLEGNIVDKIKVSERMSLYSLTELGEQVAEALDLTGPSTLDTIEVITIKTEPERFESTLYGCNGDTGFWNPLNINWNHEIDLSDEERAALAESVTQFVYSNRNHLPLCGRLLAEETDTAAQRLALLLGLSKIRNVDAWGRYLGKLSATSEVAPPTKDYVGRILSRKTVPRLLVGMGTLGGTLGYGVLDQMIEHVDEPLFREIATAVKNQKKRNEDWIVEYLTNSVSIDSEEREQLEEDARYYRERSKEIVMFHRDLLETVGCEPERVVDRVETATDDFYGRLDLYEEGR